MRDNRPGPASAAAPSKPLSAQAREAVMRDLQVLIRCATASHGSIQAAADCTAASATEDISAMAAILDRMTKTVNRDA